jgi:hypothetical protein
VKSVKGEEKEEKRKTLEISMEKCGLNNFLVQNIIKLLHVPCLKRTAQSALTCGLKYYDQTLGSCSGDNLGQKMNIN